MRRLMLSYTTIVINQKYLRHVVDQRLNTNQSQLEADEYEVQIYSTTGR